MDGLKVVESDLADLSRHSGALNELDRGELVGFVVRRFLPPDLLAESVGRIERGEVRLPRIAGPIFKGCLYGRPLAASLPDRSDYLSEVPVFEEGCAQLFGAAPTLSERFQSVLQALAGSTRVELARAGDGRRYMSGCFRVFLAGDGLPPHAENQTLQRPASAELRGLVDDRHVMSFYLPVQLPEEGGVLTVVSQDRYHDGDGALGRLGARAMEELSASGAREIRPGVGDLLIFEGGRRYHWVSPVVGARSRWTLGGFFAFSKNHDRILFWG